MYEVPDHKDLEKVVINSETVEKKTKPLMIFANRQNNQKISASKT